MKRGIMSPSYIHLKYFIVIICVADFSFHVHKKVSIKLVFCIKRFKAFFN